MLLRHSQEDLLYLCGLVAQIVDVTDILQPLRDNKAKAINTMKGGV